MANVEKISIALPPDMVTMVRSAVEGGAYASSSEVIREALRDWGEKHQSELISDLRRLWTEAVNAPMSSESIDDMFDRLEKKYQGLAGKAAPTKVK
jgi:antitoxin ParD1/3/4